MHRRLSTAALAVFLGAQTLSANAGTDTTTFQVSLEITEACDIHTTAAAPVNFGIKARQTGAVNVTQSGSVTVNCSPNTKYSIGLDGGGNASSTPVPGDRKMKGTNKGALVPYDLFQDAANSVFWGNDSSSWLTGTGTGANQTYPVYGLVTNLNFVGDKYVDVVTATVTY